MACGAEKQSVTLVRMPSLDRALQALMPSRIKGNFTTMFLWIFASFRPSAIMAADSIATTSAEMSPSMMSQIALTCSSIGLPSFAISEGFVVTPSTMPQSAPFLISSRLAVSRKIFMVIFYASEVIWFSRAPTPSITIRTEEPGPMAPTPGGVPVAMRSPGSSVIN